MSFQIKTEVFEGPLELLISLIEKREVFINDISLTQVCDDYIEHLNTMEEKDIDNMSNFIVIASTLLLIKSKSLLPNITLSTEEEEDIQDLEDRISEYRRIKDLSKHILKLIERGGVQYPRGDITLNVQDVRFAPGVDMKMESIQETITRLIAQLPQKDVEHPVVTVEKIISLEEVITDLTRRAKESLSMSFNQFSDKTKADRVDVIVRFLALLELVKTGTVTAKQNDHFEDIMIEHDSIDTPHYGSE